MANPTRSNQKSSFPNPFRSDEKPKKNKAALERIRGKPKQSAPRDSSNQSRANFNSERHGAIQVDPDGTPGNFSPAPEEDAASKTLRKTLPAILPPDPQYENAVQQIYQPNGWKKLTDAADIAGATALSYINKVRVFNGRQPLGTKASYEQKPFSPLDVMPGGASLQVYSKVLLREAGQTTVQTTLKTGLKHPAATTSAGRIASNQATKKATASYLTKLVENMRDPATLGKAFTRAVVGSLIAIIGTYPFAGYVRWEAIQALKSSRTTAIINGDAEGFQQALEMEEAITEVMFEIGMPFKNVVNSLHDAAEAATLSRAIDEKVGADWLEMLNEIQGPQQESDNGLVKSPAELREQKENEYFERIREEQKQQEQEIIDYYNRERKKMIEFEKQAQQQQNVEEAKFWAKQRAEQRRLEEADRKAQAEFWFQYRKRMQELSEATRPSKLNFGLL